jgi:hypothetical protein
MPYLLTQVGRAGTLSRSLIGKIACFEMPTGRDVRAILVADQAIGSATIVRRLKRLLPGHRNLLAKVLEIGPIHPFEVRAGPGRGSLLR